LVENFKGTVHFEELRVDGRVM